MASEADAVCCTALGACQGLLCSLQQLLWCSGLLLAAKGVQQPLLRCFQMLSLQATTCMKLAAAAEGAQAEQASSGCPAPCRCLVGGWTCCCMVQHAFTGGLQVISSTQCWPISSTTCHDTLGLHDFSGVEEHSSPGRTTIVQLQQSSQPMQTAHLASMVFDKNGDGHCSGTLNSSRQQQNHISCNVPVLPHHTSSPSRPIYRLLFAPGLHIARLPPLQARCCASHGPNCWRQQAQAEPQCLQAHCWLIQCQWDHLTILVVALLVKALLVMYPCWL